MESYEAKDGALFLEEGDHVRIISSSGDEVFLEIAAVLGYAEWRTGRDDVSREATDTTSNLRSQT